MGQFRWPIIVITTLLALGLFFGVNYYRQRFLQEEPFIESLCRMESVEAAEIKRDGGDDVLIITTKTGYRGELQELVASVREQIDEYYARPLMIEIEDRRNDRLNSFLQTVGPDLYEAARLSNYRSAADNITRTAEVYQLEDTRFAVDYEYLYLQARDGDYYLYLMILLNRHEGGDA